MRVTFRMDDTRSIKAGANRRDGAGNSRLLWDRRPSADALRDPAVSRETTPPCQQDVSNTPHAYVLAHGLVLAAPTCRDNGRGGRP